MGKVKILALAGLFAISSIYSAKVAAAGAGNTGGGCYNLELIAVKGKNVDMSGSSGHSLFLSLNGNTKIYLQEGAFNVIDRNGTDGPHSHCPIPRHRLIKS